MSNNELIGTLSSYKALLAMESELKKEKDKLAGLIKAHMGEQTELFLSEYHVIYRDVVKTVVDSDKLRSAGLYDTFSKQQVTRPLYVK